jgi:general secretion pathway protein F
MLFSPRMPTKRLAALCQHLATALTAGIDVRTAWAREAEQARGPAARQHLAAISAAVNQGASVAAVVAAGGKFFPRLFREMVEVGEQSGHLAEIFAQLAEHYRGQLRLRRDFLSAIARPVLELAIALAVVGALIWVTGLIGIDILGFGLVGDRGLSIYVAGLAAAGGLLWLVIRAVSRGLVWTRPIQRAVLRLPVLGPALQTLALARLAWSMHLTMNAGMDLRKGLRLSLRNTYNARYTDCIERIDAGIAGGNSLYEVFREAGCFPHDFLDSLQAGEQSGKLVESMALLSRQYQEQARATLTTLTMVASYAVWVCVAVLIIVLIFRIFGFYLGVLNQATKW